MTLSPEGFSRLENLAAWCENVRSADDEAFSDYLAEQCALDLCAALAELREGREIISDMVLWADASDAPTHDDDGAQLSLLGRINALVRQWEANATAADETAREVTAQIAAVNERRLAADTNADVWRQRAIAHGWLPDQMWDGWDLPLTDAVTQLTRQAPLVEAARDVLAERQRQISVEGWTPEHDDEHSRFELSRAAACYARMPSRRILIKDPMPYQPFGWPWGSGWWRPSGDRRDLIKAGALILAEIERLDRAEAARTFAKTKAPQ